MEGSLIDFSSPVSTTKKNIPLVPLIPSVQCSTVHQTQPSFGITVESNPFDMAANQMAANMAAEDDPFERAYLCALKGTSSSNSVVHSNGSKEKSNEGDNIKASSGVESEVEDGEKDKSKGGVLNCAQTKEPELSKLYTKGESVCSIIKDAITNESQGNVVPGNMVLQRLSSVGLDDILPPDSLLDSSTQSDLLNSLCTESPEIPYSSFEKPCSSTFQLGPTFSKPSTNSPKSIPTKLGICIPDPCCNISDVKPPSKPSAGTPKLSLSLTESPLQSPVFSNIHSDEDLKAMIAERVQKCIQSAKKKSRLSLVGNLRYEEQQPLGGETATSEGKKQQSAAQRLSFSSYLVQGKNESPLFDETDLCEEAQFVANIVSASSYNTGDDHAGPLSTDVCSVPDDILSSVQQPDWNSFQLPDLSDDELDLSEDTFKQSAQQTTRQTTAFSLLEAETLSHLMMEIPEEDKCVKSSMSVAPLSLCEDGIRNLSLTCKFSPPKQVAGVLGVKISDVKVSKPQNVRLQREPFSAVPQTRFALRKKPSEACASQISQRGPMKAVLPVKNMMRPSTSSHGFNGASQNRTGSKTCQPHSSSVKVVPSVEAPLAASTPCISAAPKKLTSSNSLRGTLKSIRHPSNDSHGEFAKTSSPHRSTASKLGSPRQVGIATKKISYQKQSRTSGSPIRCSRSSEPADMSTRKKTISGGLSPLVIRRPGASSPVRGNSPHTPLRKSVSNPRILADVNCPQPGCITPVRKISYLPAPRSTRRGQVTGKENCC